MAGSGFVERRGSGEDAIYLDHEGNGCTDPTRPGTATAPAGGAARSPPATTAGRRIRRKVSGQTKAAVQNKLAKPSTTLGSRRAQGGCQELRRITSRCGFTA